MAIDAAALKSELLNDPWNLGYSGHVAVGNDGVLANLLNAAFPGSSGAVFRGLIPSYEIVNNTVPADWAALTAAEKQRYQVITGAGQVDVSNGNVRNAFVSMFSGTQTFANLNGIVKRQASRAELLFSGGVSSRDVSMALRGAG